MKNKLFRFLAIVLLFVGLTPVKAQTDTEFWFAAPEVSSTHGDSPIYLRMSAQNLEANILVSIPANPAFIPITLTVPSNTTQTIDLTPFLSFLENDISNTVLSKGLFIQSNNPISAYYEVSAPNNPDIFALKGGNALGTDFYTPFQNSFNNGNFTVQPYSSFDIVATENNTTVSITPSVAIDGHAANVTFTINLNRGETYSCRAAGILSSDHATGSKITSNLPICVTIKDDSMAYESCRDLWGDQVIPTNLVGKEYIVMRGFLNNNEYAFILATEDATDIFIAGSSTPISTINAGQQYMYSIPNGQATTYIQTSEPAYVLHISGFGCEVGGAILPPIQCTGSDAVYFTRATSDLFGLNIMVRNGSQGNFLLNGNSTLVPASAFTSVPGTSNNWVAAQINFNTSQIPQGQTSILVNTSTTASLFHLGMIDGGASTGCRYGYFSDFSSANLGGNRFVCINDSLILSAGENQDSYVWNTGDTTSQITVFVEGIYAVTTSKNGCLSSDTISVASDTMVVDLGPETALLCGENVAYLNAHSGFYSYEWMDLPINNDSIFAVNADGNYWVEALSLGGCYSRDTIQIQFAVIPPTLTLLTTSPSCEGDTLTISAMNATSPVTWQGPNAFNESGDIQIFEGVTPLLNGTYTATQFNGECESNPASIQVVVFPTPNPLIVGDTIICEGDSSLLSFVNGPFDDFVWSSGETTPTIISKGGNVTLSVSKNGCSNSITQTIYLAEPLANFNSIPEYFVFLGSNFQFLDSSISSPVSENINYYWSFGDGSFDEGTEVFHLYADTGLYDVTLVVTNTEGCLDTISRKVQVVKDIIIPNVFSPNGDGINDLFEIKYLGFFETPQLRIFNRWGNQIFMSENYKSDWNGEDFPNGTYYYILDLANDIPTFKGSILIMR